MNLSKILCKSALACVLFYSSFQYVISENATENVDPDAASNIETESIEDNADYLQLIGDGDGLKELPSNSMKDNSEDTKVIMLIIDGSNNAVNTTFIYNDNTKIKQTKSNASKTYFDKDFFSRFKNLDVLVISNINMDEKFALEIEESGLNQCKLKHIGFNNCTIAKSAASQVEDELITAFNLTPSNNQLNDIESLSLNFAESQYFPEKLLNSLTTVNKLKHLWIGANILNNGIAEATGRLIATNPTLQTLSLRAMDIESNSYNAISKNIHLLKNLETLELFLGKIRAEAAQNISDFFDAFIKNNKITTSLQTLRCNFDIANLGTRRYETVKKLADLIAPCNNLKDINLSDFKLEEREVNRLFQNSFSNKKKVQLLVLDGIHFTDSAASYLANALGTMENLTNLSLNDCNLNDQTVNRLLRALVSAKLIRLYLNKNKINSIDLSNLPNGKSLGYISAQENNINSSNAEKLLKDAHDMNPKMPIIININGNNIFKNDSSFYNKYNMFLLKLLTESRQQKVFLLAD